MEIYENRIVNGLLKAEAVDDPDKAVDLLARDVEIIADSRRATEDDLWPAIWALAAVLERQFTGNVYINAGLTGPLRQPAQLSPRCIFTPAVSLRDVITINLGCPPRTQTHILYGDARRGTVHYGSLSSSSERANPLACFALAGYLGFAALALAAGIPSYREEFAVRQLVLPFQSLEQPRFPEAGLAFIGLGHLGQAYLALLFFLAPAIWEVPRIHLLDKDVFENANWSTQILVETQSQWIGLAKAKYLKERLRSWGWQVEEEVSEITWGFNRSANGPEFAVMGLDKFDVRRMAIAGGYRWLFDGGLGDSLMRPRISWHSIPGDNSLAKVLFPDAAVKMPREQRSTPFIEHLRNTPGACGLLTYEGVQASAPSLGIVASAFVWSEILRFLTGPQEQIKGSATTWSPILPPLRARLPNLP